MLERRLIEVEGIVQGVGFRPFVHRLAVERDLRGSVRNGASHVLIDVEGEPVGLDAFLKALVESPPPLSRIGGVRVKSATPRAYHSFQIAGSAVSATPGTPAAQASQAELPPDVATCTACLSEMGSPTNRRYEHPFITCTDCGPRFSVVLGVPYDRQRTTMREFPLCVDCQREYDDPGDRRFHAESTSCPMCGPTLVARPAVADGTVANGANVTVASGTHGTVTSGARALERAARIIRDGGIVAVKALGGFQLACNAYSATAVDRLRQRKGRAAKPLAVMVANVALAEELCTVDAMELDVLTSPARPVVVLRRRIGAGERLRVAPSVAPGRTTLGVMLPSTPVHHLLLAMLDDLPLVMTSGNRSGEPVVTDDGDAIAALGGIADLFLTHDRRIAARSDDSVVRVVAGANTVVRRARGLVPRVMTLPVAAPVPVLAIGGHLKNTVCLVHGTSAHVSPHVGDLESLAGTIALRDTVEQMRVVAGVHPLAIAHDLHPEYASTRFAEAFARDHDIRYRVAVQHHHAHVAACVAEHGLNERVIGVAFDGAGLGSDGAIWGGEFLEVNGGAFMRHGHLGYVPLPGGDAAARCPWRSAAAHLVHADVEADWFAALLPDAVRNDEWALVRQTASRGGLSPNTSSVGRLFDAVASMLGLCHVSRYEGEAAVALEEVAGGRIDSRYPVSLAAGPSWTVSPAGIINGVVGDLRRGRDRSSIAAAFHGALRDFVLLGCERVREETGLAAVALTGGVFANALLAEACIASLTTRRFRTYLPRSVPCNDGGLSLGQAYVAACAMREESCA